MSPATQRRLSVMGSTRPFSSVPTHSAQNLSGLPSAQQVQAAQIEGHPSPANPMAISTLLQCSRLEQQTGTRRKESSQAKSSESTIQPNPSTKLQMNSPLSRQSPPRHRDGHLEGAHTEYSNRVPPRCIELPAGDSSTDRRPKVFARGSRCRNLT